MFRGVTHLNLDSKSRLAMPAKYRDLLTAHCQGQLIVTADPSRCLLIYPLPEWEPIEQRLNGLSSFNPNTRKLQRLLVGNATDVELDGAGRILLASPLRRFADLGKSVVLVGQGNKFELWDETPWNQQMEEALELQEGGLPPELEGFSL